MHNYNNNNNTAPILIAATLSKKKIVCSSEDLFESAENQTLLYIFWWVEPIPMIIMKVMHNFLCSHHNFLFVGSDHFVDHVPFPRPLLEHCISILLQKIQSREEDQIHSYHKPHYRSSSARHFCHGSPHPRWLHYCSKPNRQLHCEKRDHCLLPHNSTS